MLGWMVSDGLDLYIAVHNKIFAEAQTLKSVFKTLLGRGASMGSLLEDAERLGPIWNTIALEVEAFRTKHPSKLTSDEIRYIGILSRYVEAVRTTVVLLIERQNLWNEGSKSWRNSTVTYFKMKMMSKRYEAAIAGYLAIGHELQAAAQTIFE